jgi:hypothetical protein
MISICLDQSSHPSRCGVKEHDPCAVGDQCLSEREADADADARDGQGTRWGPLTVIRNKLRPGSPRRSQSEPITQIRSEKFIWRQKKTPIRPPNCHPIPAAASVSASSRDNNVWAHETMFLSHHHCFSCRALNQSFVPLNWKYISFKTNPSLAPVLV